MCDSFHTHPPEMGEGEMKKSWSGELASQSAYCISCPGKKSRAFIDSTPLLYWTSLCIDRGHAWIAASGFMKRLSRYGSYIYVVISGGRPYWGRWRDIIKVSNITLGANIHIDNEWGKHNNNIGIYINYIYIAQQSWQASIACFE